MLVRRGMLLLSVIASLLIPLLVASIGLLLVAVLRVVLSRTVAPGCPSCPARAVEWLYSSPPTTTAGHTGEDKEDEDEAEDNQAESDPSAPFVPGILRTLAKEPEPTVEWLQSRSVPAECERKRETYVAANNIAK